MKTIILPILFSLFVVSVYSQWPINPVPRNGLVAYYPFCGTAKDESVNGNNGIVSGATLTNDKYGNANSAYSFNGINSSIDIPHSKYMDDIEKNNLFTYSAWIYIRSGGSNDKFSLFSKYEATNDDGWEISIKPSVGMIFLSCSKALGTNISYSIALKQWTHFVLVYNANSNLLKCYINNILISTKSFNLPLFDTYGESATIGKDLIGLDEYNDGIIDDIFIYDLALTDSEILQLYNAGAPDCLNQQMYQSDVSDSLWAIVKPEYTVKDVNVGTACINTYKDTVIQTFIKNSGTYPFVIDSMKITGVNSTEFYFVSNYAPPSYQIKPNEERNLEVGFKPIALGKRTATIELYSFKDIIRVKVEGTCNTISINIITSFIDFGKVKINTNKDTIITVVIKNTSAKPVFVSKTYKSGPDTTHFDILSGGGSFTLNPNESRTIKVRFSPSEITRLNGLVIFETSDDCQDAVVQLFGEGIPNGPSIVSSALSINDLICNIESLDTIRIMNTGGEILRINEAQILGADFQSFTLIPNFTPLDIEPKKDGILIIKFIPKTTGIHNATLVLKSNANPDSLLIIPLEAKKDSVCLIPENTFINLGNLCSNQSKDTIISIRNNGTIVSGGFISLTSHLQTQTSDFILNIAERKMLPIRFTGISSIGPFSETITIIDSICGFTKEVQIIGEIVNQELSIDTMDVGYICQNDIIDTLINISNIGKLIFYGKLSSSSNISLSKENFMLNPGEENNIALNITSPSVIGPFTGSITVTDSICGFSKVVTVSGEVVSQKISVDTVYVGYVCPEQIVDTLLEIRNIGKLKFYGKLSPSSNISLSKEYFTLNPGYENDISFNITSPSAIGPFAGSITITDSICGYYSEVNVIGEVYLPFITSEDIQISAIVGGFRENRIVIQNNSKRAVTIIDLSAISKPFELIGNPFPLFVNINDSEELPIRYTPNDRIMDSITIILRGEPCGINKSVNIIGIPATASAIIQSDSLSGYPGDTLDIPIILKNESNLVMAGVTSLKTELIFNPTLLTPLDLSAYPIQNIDEKQAKIEIINIPISGETGKTLMNIPFIVGLGNDEGCPLVLQNTMANGGTADLIDIDGTFILLGICYEGGARLVNPNGKAGIMQIIPNPASEDIEIGINLIEKGYSIVSIYNSNGKKMKEYNMTGKKGLQTINLDISEFSNGLYFVQLLTPTIVKNQKLMIIK